MDDNLRIWRSFQLGKLLDLIMLDTRNYDRSITTLGWNNEYVAELKDDAGRSLMGSHQENWFYGQLSKSASRGATWRLVGNQIIFSRINNTARSSNWLNADQWDVSHSPQPFHGFGEFDAGRATPRIATALCTTSTPTVSQTPSFSLVTRMQTGSRILSGSIRCHTTNPPVLVPLA